MGNLKPGTYSLRLAAEPSPCVGVDLSGPLVLPIVTDGTARQWIVNKMEDGKYTLSIEGKGPSLFVRDDDGNLVANTTPPPSAWVIDGPEGGPYTIQVPDGLLPPQVWTVKTPGEPKFPVTLKVLELPGPPEIQKWYFVLPQE